MSLSTNQEAVALRGPLAVLAGLVCELGRWPETKLSQRIHRELGGVSSWIDFRLQTIHPSPGTVGAGRGGRRERRRVRRVIYRREKSERRAGGVGRVDVRRGQRVRVSKIVTWNVRRLSMREHNRDRLRRILDEIRRQGWEIVLLTEISADERVVVWLVGDVERVAVIQSYEPPLSFWEGKDRGRPEEMGGEKDGTCDVGGMRLVWV